MSMPSAGSEIVIGPWSHSGFLDNRVGHVPSGKRSRFNHLTHAIGFFDRCCGRHTAAETIAELAEADATDSAGEGTMDHENSLLVKCLKDSA